MLAVLAYNETDSCTLIMEQGGLNFIVEAMTTHLIAPDDPPPVLPFRIPLQCPCSLLTPVGACSPCSPQPLTLWLSGAMPKVKGWRLCITLTTYSWQGSGQSN